MFWSKHKDYYKKIDSYFQQYKVYPVKYALYTKIIELKNTFIMVITLMIWFLYITISRWLYNSNR